MSTSAIQETEEEKPYECPCCGNETPYEENYWVEGYDSGVCRECHDDEVDTCQLCGDDDVQKSQVSRYIVVKTELADTDRRLPGIYRVKHYPFLSIPIIGGGSMHGSDVLFIDRLPRPDREFEISGHICAKCAAPYEVADKEFYGRVEARVAACKQSWKYNWLWHRERERVSRSVAAHPEMLRDLEEDYQYSLSELRKLWGFSVFAPTWNEYVFLEHSGVKIYWTDEERDWANWLTMRPEPRYRSHSCHPPGIVFAPRGLATWEKIPLRPDRSKDAHGHYYDTGYRYGNEQDFITAAEAACRRAIDAGIITRGRAPEDAR